MWTPAWYDLLLHPATWVVIGIALGLLAAWGLRAVWRIVKKGGA